MYITQQDAQNSCDQTLFSIRYSACFGLYQSIFRSNFISCTSHFVGISRYHTSGCCVAIARGKAHGMVKVCLTVAPAGIHIKTVLIYRYFFSPSLRFLWAIRTTFCALFMGPRELWSAVNCAGNVQSFFFFKYPRYRPRGKLRLPDFQTLGT